ncbi:uncharacterized protein LJ206_003435 isoform 1-T1 [Theristicus caerulescens]
MAFLRAEVHTNTSRKEKPMVTKGWSLSCIHCHSNKIHTCLFLKTVLPKPFSIFRFLDLFDLGNGEGEKLEKGTYFMIVQLIAGELCHETIKEPSFSRALSCRGRSPTCTRLTDLNRS